MIRGLVADLSGDLWVVTGDGLWCRHTSGSAVTWIRWETDDALGDAIADPDRPGVWVRSGASAVFASISDEAFAHAQVGGSGGPLAIAPSGVLWASDGSALMAHSGWGAPPPSFAKEIAPFSSANCQACHGSAMSLPLVTHEEWLRNSQRILVNLRAGTMPRGEAMSASEFRIVTRWVEGGMLP